MRDIKTVGELQRLEWAITDVTGYLTDNSCGDPECCGGPYYSEEEYCAAVDLLKTYGLDVSKTSIERE